MARGCARSRSGSRCGLQAAKLAAEKVACLAPWSGRGVLLLTFGPTCKAELEHYHYESFRARFDTPVLPPVPVPFRLGGNGKVESVVVDLAGTAEIRRAPEPRGR